MPQSGVSAALRGERKTCQSSMSERRILTEDQALRLLAHFYATADLHVYESPHYADRRILEGTIPLLDAMIENAAVTDTGWVRELKSDLERALASRRVDRDAYDEFLHNAPGRIASEIKRRQSS